MDMYGTGGGDLQRHWRRLVVSCVASDCYRGCSQPEMKRVNGA